MRLARGDPDATDRAPVHRRRALELLAAHERALRGTARRVSLCSADADDAFAQALEILLTKAPSVAPGKLAAWMHVVVRREALSVRRSRERLLSSEVEHDVARAVAADAPGPAELAERRERCRAELLRLARLKPDERLAIVLQAQGYSYGEICRLRGWSYTKVNRCLAEGRTRLRQLGALL